MNDNVVRYFVDYSMEKEAVIMYQDYKIFPIIILVDTKHLPNKK